MALTTLDARTALVLVDLQEGIVAMDTVPIPSSRVVAHAKTLAEAFRAHGLPVILVRVTAAADGSDAVPGRSEAAPPPNARAEGWDRVVAPLQQDGDVLVTKRQWG